MKKAGLDNPPPYGSHGNDGKQQHPGGQQYPGGKQYPERQQYGQPYPGQQPNAGQQPNGGQTHMQNTSAVIVTQPGYPGVVTTMARPPDYMVASIFACLCCFWPTGLCAIYYASQANNAAASGDMEAANRYSNSARNLMITSIVFGVIWIVLVIVLRVVVSADYYNSY